MNNGPDAEPVEERRRARAPGTRFRDRPECPEMAVAPAGSRMMGSPFATPALSTSVVRCLAAWALLACGASAPADEPAGRAASKEYTRIVGGMEAEARAWPWQVALIYPQESDFEQFCGGSVIDQRWVLTASHCVDGASSDDIQVLVGTQDLDEGGRRIDVEAIRMHRAYRDDTLENDIALLKLARKAGVDEVVTLPDAERSAEVAEPGAMATAIGWGLLRPIQCAPGSKEGAHRCRPRGGGAGHYVDDLTGRPVDLSDVFTSRLMQVELPLVGEQTCRNAYSGAPIDHRTLCAGLRKGGKDSCQGDSGGPLVVRDGDEWVQVGVVSWGAGCAKPGKYGVYTNTGSFAEWVNETTGRELVVSGGAAETEDPSPGTASEDTVPAPPRGDRALLIGINRYANSDFNLGGAVRDAHNMRGLLTGYLGFDAGQIRLLTDAQATREGILKGIRNWLVAGTRPGARALLYFAGHGYYQADDNGDETDRWDEALVPHDAQLVSASSKPLEFANLIIDDEIGELFDDLADRQAYLIVDSCHSGTITRSMEAPDPSVVRTIDLRLGGGWEASGTRAATRSAGPDGSDQGFIERKGNLIAWTAVESNQLALEDLEAPERQGFFTGRFVRGIAEQYADDNRDGRVVHSELLRYVRSESEAYCERQKKHCQSGLTPMLEGPPDVKTRDLRDLAVVTTGGSTTGAVAEAALGHGNAAGVRLEILPSRRVRLGEEITFRVHSERSGHLLIVHVSADGDVTQLFPNQWSERAGADATIAAGRTVEIPNPYYGFALTATEPVGQGILFAIVTEDPVSLDGLASIDRGGFKTVPDAPRWLLAIGERLDDPLTLMKETGPYTRMRRWSYARVDYEVVR